MSDITNQLIRALELDRDGDWDTAHRIVQSIEHRGAYMVHAYLHRKEGVLSNAEYWYKRAKKKMPRYDLAREWQELCDYITADR